MLVTPVMLLLWTYVLIFIFCELGERVSTEYNRILDEIEQSNWYSLPMELQRMFPFVIIIAQEPTILHGFGNCLCTRESFKNVRANN